MARVYTYDCGGEIMRDLVVDESLYFGYEDFLRMELGVPYEVREIESDSQEFDGLYMVTDLQKEYDQANGVFAND